MHGRANVTLVLYGTKYLILSHCLLLEVRAFCVNPSHFSLHLFSPFKCSMCQPVSWNLLSLQHMPSPALESAPVGPPALQTLPVPFHSKLDFIQFNFILPSSPGPS